MVIAPRARAAPGEALKITSDDPAHALVSVAANGSGK